MGPKTAMSCWGNHQEVRQYRDGEKCKLRPWGIVTCRFKGSFWNISMKNIFFKKRHKYCLYWCSPHCLVGFLFFCLHPASFSFSSSSSFLPPLSSHHLLIFSTSSHHFFSSFLLLLLSSHHLIIIFSSSSLLMDNMINHHLTR